jgi:pyruvate-ferredoxin/flavodoxin oxidoreductase
VKLAEEAGLGIMINTIMQSAFFALNEQILPYDKAVTLMKKYAKKAYGRKGQDIVDKNYAAIDAGKAGLVKLEVKPEWADLKVETKAAVDNTRPDFVKNIADPVNAIKGYDLPVSVFEGYEDGTMDNGGTAYEKRGIANYVPEWIDDNCIQCNQCAFACPHAVIRPFLLTEEEMANAPEGLKTKKAVGKGLDGLQYKIQISTLDCTGCGVCVEVCPAKTKALAMSPIHEEIEKGEIDNSEYLFNKVTYKDNLVGKNNAKNSQFAKPLFEFSGACAGCGETPYIKLITQLFGERMQIANATGCSSIYGASFPATPYTTLDNGRGPAWANSLFEDNAEFGFGMRHANEALRDQLQNVLIGAKDELDAETNELVTEWIEGRADGDKSLEVYNKLMPLVEKSDATWAKKVAELSNYIVKQSNWIIGGDGWAYDIGYGGLDHVMANEEDVNILVLDTEVYSNTGGQSSKSAPTGSIAKFTASGKGGKKKDLAAIAMSYGHVYVAQVSHGASQQQVLKAFKEAESYPGPSIVLAYSPCIAHKIKGGLTNSQNQAKLATECGYWPTFRFDPRLQPEGKNPFVIDSKPPKWDRYREFLMNEARYAQLVDINPEHAEELLVLNKQEAQRRYAMYERYAAMDYSIGE